MIDLTQFFIDRPKLQSLTVIATGEVVFRGDVLFAVWAERHFDVMARPMAPELGHELSGRAKVPA